MNLVDRLWYRTWLRKRALETWLRDAPWDWTAAGAIAIVVVIFALLWLSQGGSPEPGSEYMVPEWAPNAR